MKNKPNFIDYLRYKFDETLSRGAVGLIGWLALFSILLILAISYLVWSTQIAPDAPSFVAIFWMSLMRTLDPGTMGGDQGSWPFLISMLIITLGGIFIISTLIGVINNVIFDQLEELRKGRSRVLENGHTVILGWTQEIFTILTELIITNINKHKPSVVILAQKDKIFMEDEIREKIGDCKNTKIVCRTGSPLEFSDLEMTNLKTAHSIIILSPDDNNPDAEVIKTTLAIVNNPDRKKEKYHIVASMKDPVNFEVAQMVGKDEVELLMEDDIISRIIAQTCRQSGLSVIYKEILDYAGDEIYFSQKPQLEGLTFAEALFKFEDSLLIGIMKKGEPPRLNPNMQTVIEAEDQLIFISADQSTIHLSNNTNYQIDESIIRKATPCKLAPEKTLILGWNSRTTMIINQLDNYVAKGTKVTVVDDKPGIEKILPEECKLRNQEVNHIFGDTTNRKLLEKLELEQFDHIILLTDMNLPPQQADSKLLITLLHLRDISRNLNRPFSIVSEMIDSNNCRLASVAKADDFIVGTELISFLLTQISENKLLSGVFAEIFDAEGNEIYLKPASDYVEINKEVNFYTIVESAKQKNEIAIGYRVLDRADRREEAFGVVINPAKSKKFTLKGHDRIIVLAQG
ncbi:MAG: CASTOR/POLLUX-related putative ion channel [Vulcanimicrobiota bacterium]